MTKLALVALAAVAAVAPACTTLGPMPSTTGVSAIPTDRPSTEVQVGLMPAFFLSESAQEEPRGSLTGQVAAVVEPDRWLNTKGLILGLRSWGETGDGAVEPMIGYRRRFDRSGSIGIIGYGTHMAGESSGARYQGTHLGGELAVDSMLVGNQWIALHVQAAASLTYLGATGSYCIIASTGWGADCDGERDRRVHAALSGLFPAATASFTLDLARRSVGVFHGLRLAFLTTYGAMPVIRYAEAYATTSYSSVGLSLTIGLGADR